MEYVKPPLVKLMAKYQRYEPTVRDSTAVMSAKTCKRLYFLERVLGFVPKESQPYFSFGTCYHKFREVLEKSHMAGKDEATCLKEALDSSGKLWKQIGSDPPVGTRWEFLTGKRLFASCMEAFKWWQNEKKQGRIIVVAVEQVWQVYLKDGITLIGGRADQITRFNGKLWGRDWKTSSKMGKFYERTLEPNDQFTRYTLGEGKLKGEQIQGQLVEVMYNTAKEGPKIVPLITSRTPEQLGTRPCVEAAARVLRRIVELDSVALRGVPHPAWVVEKRARHCHHVGLAFDDDRFSLRRVVDHPYRSYV